MLWRDHDGDRLANITHVHPGEGTVTLFVIGQNGPFIRDRVAREPEPDKGGMRIQGLWRFPPEGGQSLIPDP